MLVRRVLLVLSLAVAGCFLKSPEPAPRHARPRDAAIDPDTDVIAVTWIGHATALIRIKDRWILTDPVLGDRIAKVYARKVSAGIEADALPRLDAVVISHAHFDHLDTPSLQQIEGDALLFPPNLGQYLPGDLRFAEITGVDTWDSVVIDDIKLTAVPASHSSARYMADRWSDHGHTGWIIEYAGHTVYFAGDTGYDEPAARELAKRYDIDVALIPVGPAGRAAWIERLRRKVHVTPKDAMELFAACEAQWMVPIHFGTFFQTAEHELPHIRKAIDGHPRGDRVRLIGVGDTTEFFY